MQVQGNPQRRFILLDDRLEVGNLTQLPHIGHANLLGGIADTVSDLAKVYVSKMEVKRQVKS